MHVLRGKRAILGSRPILDELASISDQPGTLRDLAYHLSTPDAQKKTPCLILVPVESGIGEEELSARGFVGAVLVFEYKIFGLGSRVYASADMTGRRTVIGPAAFRARIAAYACRCLLEQGAQVVLTSIYEPGEDSIVHAAMTTELDKTVAHRRVSAVWSMLVRKMPLYLPLAATFNETLARIGKKTRTNLRYYRRRAEKELGCVFIPEAHLELEEFLAFNRECMFAVTDELSRWRYEALSKVEHPFLQGIQDRNGRWLSLACGRRTGQMVELEWQCNRADLPSSSLSTVMRSYLIEHEAELGMERLYFEGGTPSSLQQSFLLEGVADLTIYRRSTYVWLLRKLAAHLFPQKNYLAQILTSEQLVWMAI